MRITIAAVGRAKAGPARDLYDFYAARLSERQLGALTLKEVEARGHLPPEELKAREAELLLGALPASARLIALDERGRSLDSAGFAALIGGYRDQGLQELAFAIGGAEGLGQAVTERAELLLSLGALTWPHLLVRGLLAEQLYRAQCILTGHPYHRA
ncbi:MAG: 23S rRNA (pseudouridine(1915)-N(3))-methyltransferase RlmH [Kiloniellales bacterium]